ncbi:MAG: minor capsid protein [Anaerolineaceae bacterium]|nr:minor capsid protein [Anaerolineaceae bacterium]
MNPNNWNGIKTPKGWTTANGSIKATLKWNPARFEGDGKDSWNGRFQAAQEWLDKTVLNGSNVFVPKVTGMLQTLGVIGTVVGSGQVIWLGPYARRQYYLFNRKTSQNINPKFDPTEPRWFERWKAANGQQAIETVKQMVGGQE